MLHNGGTRLQAAWTLQTSLKLPWHPFLNVIGATEYTLNPDANQVLCLSDAVLTAQRQVY